MRIAYTTTFDANDVHNWSGTPYYMSNALSEAAITIEYAGNFKRQLPTFFKLKQWYSYFLSGQRHSPRFNIVAAKSYSQQLQERLKNFKVDAIIAPQINPIAYLDCKKPLILWTDALYAAMLGFYPAFNSHATESILQANEITSQCLNRACLAIFSSEWAARSAIELYGIHKEKIRVIPFGANLKKYPTYSEIQDIVKKRCFKTIKLLFLAKSWQRKGGDIVLAVTKALHTAGYPVELTIIGYDHLPHENKIPPFVKCLGFISKNTPSGRLILEKLLAESHFLFVPSRAEAYGIVFCEANAFALPCLSTYIGGIPTIIKDHINGMTFSLNASIQQYCDYIVNSVQERETYNKLAFSAYNEFCSRLNWQVAATTAKKYISEIL